MKQKIGYAVAFVIAIALSLYLFYPLYKFAEYVVNLPVFEKHVKFLATWGMFYMLIDTMLHWAKKAIDFVLERVSEYEP